MSGMSDISAVPRLTAARLLRPIKENMNFLVSIMNCHNPADDLSACQQRTATKKGYFNSLVFNSIFHHLLFRKDLFVEFSIPVMEEGRKALHETFPSSHSIHDLNG
jgi:hypothetical protein